MDRLLDSRVYLLKPVNAERNDLRLAFSSDNARSRAKKAITTLLCATASSLSLTAYAQSASPPTTDKAKVLGEVVVTSQKRASTVQKTPVSITAVSGDDLQDRGITNFTTLAQSTPGVSLKSEGPGQTEIELRGMTSSGGNSPTVGFYLDDIPLTALRGAKRQGGDRSDAV